MAISSTELGWLQSAAAVHRTSDLVVHVTGEDALTWLNGQITNDIRELQEGVARYATSLTVKGRVVSDLWVVKSREGLALLLPATHAEAALARFEQHIIMEDVELEPDAERVVVTLQGPRAEELLSGLAPSVPRYACPRLGSAGFDCWLPRGTADATIDLLARHAAELGGGALDDVAWAEAHVALAVPRMGQDFGEQSYPQEAGLTARALSFSKGCYLGQEVVYMLEKRGQLARRLVQLEGPSSAVAVTAGTPVTDSDGRRIGELTSLAAAGADGAPLALAYVKRPHADPEQRVWLLGSPWRVRQVVGAA